MLFNSVIALLNVLTMILLEQNIEILLSHLDRFRKYNVVEVLKDDEGVSFTVFADKTYLFTLIPIMKDCLSFNLSDRDTAAANSIDLDLFSKIKASLYSVFLSQPLS